MHALSGLVAWVLAGIGWHVVVPDHVEVLVGLLVGDLSGEGSDQLQDLPGAALSKLAPMCPKGMREEDLRQHFLVQLNGHYEGQASGETFNFEGKTDILIRAEGRNIFIAECKIWDGAESVTKAIDQLLGYASWRDTKVALLIFNRSKNLSSVVAKVRAAVRANPNYRRDLPYPSETDCRVVLHHKNDTDRELILTTMVFEVPA